MSRRLHLLLLILTCFSVGAEVLLAANSLPLMPADQVHDCGSEDARLPGEAGADEAESVGPPSPGDRMAPAARLATTPVEVTLPSGREGMRRHRWCRVDLN